MDFDVEDIPGIRKALTFYRVMAWIVGVFLIVLTLVGMPLKYVGGDQWGPLGSQIVTVVGVAHGWLYMILLISAYNLGRKVSWPWVRLLLIALGGTVPFMSFVAEHFATKDVRARIFAVRESSQWTQAAAVEPRASDETPLTLDSRIDPEA